MSTPPRRRRSASSPPPPGSPGNGGGWLPTIAIGIGVIIAGLGIGALLAAYGQRHAGPVTPAFPTSVPSITPVPRDSVASSAPLVTPRPSPSPSPSPDATDTPEPSASPSPSADASLEPSAVPTRRPTPAASLEPSAVPTRRPTPNATLEPSAAPTHRPTPAPSLEPSAAPATPTAAATAGITATAPHVVHAYIDALARGDEDAGYAALGAAAGDPRYSLKEEAFIDPSARITSLRTTRVDGSSATVECEIVSDKGDYYATFRVTRGPHGAYISEHDYIKV